MKPTRVLIVLLAIASLVGASLASADQPTKINPKIPRLSDVQGTKAPEWLDGLRTGGYVIFFRHAATDWSQRDTDYGSFEAREAQRNLSEAGKADAAAIGKAFQALGIATDTIYTSPMYRCRDTADIAFGSHELSMALFGKVPQAPGKVDDAAEARSAYRATRLAMLSEPPVKGQNRILVGQQDPMLPVIPDLHRDELREGEALVIRPLGKGQFKILAQVTVADWTRLAANAKTSQ